MIKLFISNVKCSLDAYNANCKTVQNITQKLGNLNIVVFRCYEVDIFTWHQWLTLFWCWYLHDTSHWYLHDINQRYLHNGRGLGLILLLALPLAFPQTDYLRVCQLVQPHSERIKGWRLILQRPRDLFFCNSKHLQNQNTSTLYIS